jgi:hypothetical protein
MYVVRALEEMEEVTRSRLRRAEISCTEIRNDPRLSSSVELCLSAVCGDGDVQMVLVDAM